MDDLSQTLSDARKVAVLNDAFRTTFLGGTICVTAGIHLLGDEFVKVALLAAREFAAFTQEDDPRGEHDFGALEIEGRRIFWMIEYYDPSMTTGSENPADVELTRRVLTVMLAEEY